MGQLLAGECSEDYNDDDYEVIRASGATDWVLAAPFRAHVRHVGEVTGLPWRVLALCAGVEPTLVRHLLFGRDGRLVRRLHVVTARQLLALDTQTFRLLAGQRCRAEHTHQRVRALLTEFETAEIARLARTTPSEIQRLASGRASTCGALTALLVHGLWDAHRRNPAHTQVAA